MRAVIHINNLQMNDPDLRDAAVNKRSQSRSKIFMRICDCRELYMPHELAQIGKSHHLYYIRYLTRHTLDARVAAHIDEESRLFREKEELERKVKEIGEQMKETKIQADQRIKELEHTQKVLHA